MKSGKIGKKCLLPIVLLNLIVAVNILLPLSTYSAIYDPGPADGITTLIEYPYLSEYDPNDNRIPLILIHGINGTNDEDHNGYLSEVDIIEYPQNDKYWKEFLSFFNNSNDLKSRYKIYQFYYLSNKQSVWNIARSLRNHLDDAIDKGNNSNLYSGAKIKDVPFVILAHSMGGLVARSYMQEHSHLTGKYGGKRGGERIYNLITLATPHHGSPGANEVSRNQMANNSDMLDQEYCWQFRWGQIIQLASFWNYKKWDSDLHIGTDEYSRRDLLWDNFDNVMNNNNNDINEWLRNLNNESGINRGPYDHKIIAYHGYIDPQRWDYSNILDQLYYPQLTSCRMSDYSGSTPPLLGSGPGGLLENIVGTSDEYDQLLNVGVIMGKGLSLGNTFPFQYNDGLVPQSSAAFNAHIIPKRVECVDYDHKEMRDGEREDRLTKTCRNGKKLFNSVTDDLGEITHFSLVSQLEVNAITAVPEGGTIFTASEGSIIFKSSVYDPGNKNVRLEIELREANSNFQGQTTPDSKSAFEPNGSIVTIMRGGLVQGDYHWQTRMCNVENDCSPWKEYGSSGNTDFTIVLDNIKPNIIILSPSNGTTIEGKAAITVSCSDNIGVKRVDYFINDSKIAFKSISSFPFNIEWDSTSVSNGPHVITAIAFDKAGNASLPSAISIIAENTAGNNSPNLPTFLTQWKSDGQTGLPLAGTTNERTVVMKGGVSDPDGNAVFLEVEVKPVGTSFSNTPSSNCSASTSVPSGGTAIVTCFGLSDGHYHWQARGRDNEDATGNWQGAGENPESTAFIVSAGGIPVNYPPIVTLSSPVGGEVWTVGNPYNVTWTATDNTGTVQYVNIFFSYDGGGNWSLISSSEPNDGVYTWVPSSPTTMGRIKVEAVDSYGLNGNSISNANFSINSSCPTPSPTSLPGIVIAGTSYNVGWAVSSGANYYNLQQDTTPSFNNPSVIYVGTGNSWYSGGQLPGTYYYRVKAINNCGESSWSNIQSATIQANQSPGPITAIGPADGSTNQPLTATLSWNASHPGGESLKYNVYVSYSDTSFFFTNNIRSYGQTGTTYNLSNLPYNTVISWGIEAIDQTGDIRFSQMFHFTTIGDSSPPTGSILINNGASTTTSYSVKLNISAADTGSGVRYMRFSNDGSNWTNWELFASEYPWNLVDWRYGGPSNTNVYTVYAQFRDYQNNDSGIYSDSITKVAGTPGQIILKSRFYETIQDAINAASAGDVVYLTEGVYEIPGETIPTNYPNRSTGIQMKPGVTLRGAGQEKTTIDVKGYAFAGIIDADNSSIEGLTIINSGTLAWRYVVLLESTSSSIRNCLIKGGASGIYIGFERSALNSEIAYNVIEGNSTSGIWLNLGTTISIHNNTIMNNNSSSGYGFFGYLGSASMANNIITKSNVGVFSYNAPSIFRNNNVYVDVSGGSPANYSGIPDQTGINGNISVNPSLANPSGGNYHLNPGSPCIDAGYNMGIPYNGSAPDMGAFEYDGAGTIQMTSNRTDASFIIAGPEGTYNGNGENWSMSGLPIGLYSITFAPITNYYSPPYQALVLFSGQTITFDGTYATDTMGPTGKMSLNFDEYATSDNLVTITFELTDEIGGLSTGSQMMFSNDGVTWSVAEPYSTIKKGWDLLRYGGSTASGMKTIYAKVSDSLGNWATLTDTILYVPNRQILEIPTYYATIQSAIDAAQAGDMVYVLPGQYNIDGGITVILKEGVRLQGAGPNITTITGSSMPTIKAERNTQIDGFGGYFRISVVDVVGGPVIISNNLIRRGVSILDSNGIGTETIVRNNVFIDFNYGLIITGNTLMNKAQVFVENNTFFGLGTAIVVQGAAQGAKIIVKNNIVSNNSIGIKDSNTSDSTHQHIFPMFNTYWSNGNDFGGYFNFMGPGDTNSDPMFADAANIDFRLQPASSCVNSGYLEASFNDPDGTRNDRGAYGGPSLNTPPKAEFVITPAQGSAGTFFTFDSSLSHDGETQDYRLKVRWDLNGDGIFDTNFTTEKLFSYKLSTPAVYNITLQVQDEDGFISTAIKSVEVINQPPNVPSNPTTANGSTGQPTDAILSWAGGDPNPQDAVKYDVYFGTSSNPPLISSNQGDAYFSPGILDYRTTYYWRVAVTDSFGVKSEGPLWSFVTGDPEASISFSPSALSFSTNGGGPNPSDQSISIWNSGGKNLNWSVSGGAAWLSLSPQNGINSGLVTVSVNTTGLAAGTFNSSITISAAGVANSPLSIPVTLIVSPPLDTTPPSLSITSHTDGQHVATSSITLTGTATDSGKGGNGIQQVTVNGVRASNDTAAGNGIANWSKVVPLNPGTNTITVVAYDNSQNYNTTTQTITIYRQFLQPFPFTEDFSTDKGWTGYETGGWERGPAVAGGGESGNPDPGLDHSATTNNYILGFVIGGDYPNNLVEKSIVSPPVDCSGQSKVFLKFWRYLNVQNNNSDHARVFVSNDGVNWTQLWENPVWDLTDNKWTQVVFDISSVAANQATVYIKFTMGPADSSRRFSGWNIDDLEVSSNYGGRMALYVPYGDSPNPNIDELLIKNGLGIKHSSGIPTNLSDYSLIIVDKYEACNPTTANYIKNILQNGGGAIIMTGTPMFLAGNTNDLSAIKDWFGAGWYGNDCGYAAIAVSNPFGTNLLLNDKVDYSTISNCLAPSVYDLQSGATPISAWIGFNRSHSFIYNFGKGRLLYYAGEPGYSEDPEPVNIGNGLTLFEAGLLWAAFPPCKGDFDNDGDVDGSDLTIFAAEFGRTNCGSGPPCKGDFDGDGDVDESDLVVFIADFGRTDCPKK